MDVGATRRIAKVRRYLGDLATMQIHDTAREQDRCRLDRTRFELRRWYGSIETARSEGRYERCFWCFGPDS